MKFIVDVAKNIKVAEKSDYEELKRKARQKFLEGLEGFDYQLMEGILDIGKYDYRNDDTFIPSVFLTEKVTASLMSLLNKGKIHTITGCKDGILIE